MLALARRSDRPDDVDREPEARPELLQRLRRPRPRSPEVHVVPDDDVRELEMAQQEVAHERLRLEARERQREALEHRHVRVERTQTREPVV